MNRSGMKRGLAATAVSALAVTGITLGMPDSASAAGGVDFVTQQDSTLGSVQFDGVNNTIKLEATGPAAAAKMLFEFSTNGGGTYTDIATVAPIAGLTGTKVFSTEWAPASTLYGTNVVVRSRAISSVDTPILGAFDIQTVAVSSNVGDQAVSISNAPGSELGVYQRPGSTRVNGIVSGATSDIVGGASVDLNSYTGGAADTAADFFGPVANGSRPYSGVANFAGDLVDNDGDPVNNGYALARAEDDSDDVVPVRLYKQEIGSGTNATVNRTLIPAGETATVTVTVLDQKGAPVAGARVRREGGPAIPQLTNSRGQATFPGLLPSPTGTQYRYYVDNNDNGNYEEATEYARTFTITSYVAVASTISASSDLGNAWDRDETAAVTINVQDQNAQDFGPQQVQYQWSVVPDSGPTPAPYPIGTANVAGFGPNKGNANIGDVPANIQGTWTLKSWIESNGNPGLNGDTVGNTQTFKVGQASVKWDDGTVQQSPTGTVGKVYSGKLVLGDGTPLGNRTFNVNLGDKNGADDAVIAAQAAQPDGTTRAPVFPNGDTQASVVTKADGSFGVAVSDPTVQNLAVDQFEDRTLNAAGGDYAPSTALEIDFLDITVGSVAQDAGTPIVIDGHTKTPGRPVNTGEIRVYNPNNRLLTDKTVTVSVDHGYLTPFAAGDDANNLTAAAPRVAGEKVGEWKNDGQSENFTTKDGPALGGADRGAVNRSVASAISADAGFDDDGSQAVKLTATSATKSADTSTTYTTANPLNAAAPVLTFATSNESRILPKAPTTTNGGLSALIVNQDLVIKDQFGNRTDESADLTDDDATATVNSPADAQFVGEPSAVHAQSSPLDSSNQTTTATYNGRSNLWKVSGPNLVIDSQDKTVAGNGPTINWYVVSLASSVYTMTHSGTGNELVGGTVTETYSAQDQEGQPLRGYHTELFRTGPDKLQNGNPQNTLLTNTTNVDGKSVYTFQGAAAGKAILAGVLYNGLDNAPAEASRKNDTVTFAEPTQPGDTKTPITATLTMSNNSTGNDVFKVKTVPAAKGALVTYYKFLASGTKVKIGTGTIGNDGTATFTFADKFKNTNARYSATVGEGATTKSNYTKRVTIK